MGIPRFPHLFYTHPTMIHPVIRIFTFLVFAALISLADPAGLILAATGVAVLYVLIDVGHLGAAWVMIRRMRWFFLSIAILFFWFTPGQPLALLAWLPLDSSWLPTLQGMETGVLRVASLALIILAVNLLLRTSSRDELFAAIHWMARPLSVLGISPERLAVRMVLVMDALAEVQDMVRGVLDAIKGKARSLRHIGHFSSEVFSRVSDRAEAAPCRTIELAGCSAPPLYQWLYPLLLGGGFCFF